MKSRINSFVSGEGRFSGYAYVLGEEHGGVSVSREALLEVLAEEQLPRLLWQHDETEVIGTWEELAVDDKGLRVSGKFDLNTERGREAASLVQSGAMNGLSMGYEPLETDGKVHTKIRLWEISLVTFPAIERATIDEEHDRMKSVQIYDSVEIEDAGQGAPRYTADGYVTANVRAARVGVQTYRGAEIGRPDVGTVRVYRPESEVFSKDSLSTYAHRPVTNDHPPVAVDADNWRKYSVGMVGDEVVRDGQFVRVPMVLMDRAAIKDFEAGKKQLSLGYTTVLDWKPGVTKDGEPYDAVQTQIRANHLAVVTAARGGPMLKIGDADTSNKEKHMKNIMVDGLPVQTDDNGAVIIDRVVGGLTAQVKTLSADVEKLKNQVSDGQTALAASQAETKKVTETKDAEIDVLKKKLTDAEVTPAKLDALVKDRAEVVGKARAVLGDKLVVDGKTVAEIKKQVVDAKMGEISKSYSEDAYAASFSALTADVKADERRDEMADALGGHASGTPASTLASDADKAHAEYRQRLEGGWKTKAA